LRKDIKGNKIKSVRDEEVTEITQVKKIGSKWPFYIAVGAGSIIVIAAILAAIFVFMRSSKEDPEGMGMKKIFRVTIIKNEKSSGTDRVA
jgi:hypothetical protein